MYCTIYPRNTKTIKMPSETRGRFGYVLTPKQWVYALHVYSTTGWLMADLGEKRKIDKSVERLCK